MTFPTIGTPVATETPVGQNHLISLPSVTTGNLLMIALANGNAEQPTGISAYNTIATRTDAGWHAVIAKVVDGSEETELPISTAGNSKFNALAFEVSSWFGALSGVAAALTGYTGGASEPYASPTLAPLWGAADQDTTWLAMYMGDSTISVVTPPANYSLVGSSATALSAGASVYVYSRQYAAASETPGVWDMNRKRSGETYTLGIQPADTQRNQRMLLLGA